MLKWNINGKTDGHMDRLKKQISKGHNNIFVWKTSLITK